MATVTAKQKASLTKKAKQIQSTFNKVKGNLSSSDRKSLGSSLSKANSAVSTLRKSSGSTSRSSGDRINEAYDKALAEKNGAITASDLSNKVEPYQPPTVAPAIDLTGQSNQINAMLAGANGGTYDPATGFTNPTPTDTTGEKGFEDLFKSYMGTQEQLNADRPSQESFVREMQKELRPKENLVNSLQGQIASITADRDAKQLGLEGQGRGITDTIIGGQQARIGREAAIQALPIQAQLAAAQGDLDSARTYLGQLYQAKSADAQAEYQYKTSLASSIYGFLNSQQQRRVDAVTKANDQKYAEKQANLAYQRQLGLQALEYKQNGLISGIASVDPSSPTFEQDMAAFTAQLRKPVAASKPTLQNFGTSDNPDWRQYDFSTRQWVAVEGVGGTGEGVGQDPLAQFSFLRDSAQKVNELADGASPNPVAEFVRKGIGSSSTKNTQLQGYVDTLKANMLTLATDPSIKQFFGPQMSDADVRLMTAAGSNLRPNEQTPAQLREEVRRIDDLLNRAETAVKQGMEGNNSAYTTITAPDGTLIEIID